MDELYREFREQGLEILAFPSNDFAGQEPLEGEAIKQFCMTRYDAEYPIFDKIHVVGPKADDLYKFLSDKSQNGRTSIKPKWNFHKYLIGKDGRLVEFYYSITKPNSNKIKRAISKLLKEEPALAE